MSQALSFLNSVIRDCTGCKLGDGTPGVLPVYVGDPTKARLLVIGEASGANEVIVGEPFIGDSGQVLRTALALAGCTNYALANAVLHHPPKNRTPTKQEVAACNDWLDIAVIMINPTVVCCVGKTAQSAWDLLRWKHPKVVTVFTHHPAYTLRRPGLLPEFQKAIQSAVNLADLPVGVSTGKSLIYAGRLSLAVGEVALDTEYHTEKPHRLISWSSSYGLSGGVSRQFGLAGESRPPLSDVMIFHNAKADMPLLGVDMHDTSRWEDTMLLAYCLREPEVGLKPLAHKLGGLGMTEYTAMLRECYSEVPNKKEGKPPKKVPAKNFAEAHANNPLAAEHYAMEDAEATAQIYPLLRDRLRAQPRQEDYYYDIEKPMSAILADMEQVGIRLDQDVIQNCLTQAQTAEEYALSSLPPGLDNPSSTRQVAAYLQSFGAQLTEMTETGMFFKVDEEVLLQVSGFPSYESLVMRTVGPNSNSTDGIPHICASLLTLRKAQKFRTTYCEAYQGHHRIYTDFNQTQTDTNRLSSSDPNLQNVPKGGVHGAIRGAFLPEKGDVWLRLDCSQMELRILASYTQDPTLLRAYPSDGSEVIDIHQLVAADLGIMRDVAKNAVYAKAYGSGVPTFAKTAGLPEMEAAWVYHKMAQTMPGLAQWASDSTKLFEAQGYLESKLGWRMEYPHYWSPIKKQASDAKLSLVNGRIQATGSGLFKVFMIRARPILVKYGAVFLLQVHDEVGISCQRSAIRELVEELSQLAYDLGMEHLGLPLDVSADFGPSWGYAKIPLVELEP